MFGRVTRPLALHLLWLVLASLVPACWFAASVATSVFNRDWTSAMALVGGGMALVAGLFVSVALGRELKRAVDDLAVEAGMLSRARTAVRLHLAIGELQAVADALNAAAARAGAFAAPPVLARSFAPDARTAA